LQIESWAATDNGRQRDHNEDNFFVDKKLRMFVVADGMGGHAAGEVASSLCVRKVHDILAGNRDLLDRFHGGDKAVSRSDVLRVLEHAVQTSCSAIYERAKREPEKRGMGTTCSLLLLAGDRGFIAHVGDSRIYLMRQGQVHQLSDDHSLVNELVRRGKLKLEEVDSSPYKDYKNAVTRAVGVYESVDVDTLDFDVLPGDQFLLCSDGLHAYLDDEKINRVIADADVKTITKELIDIANRGGGHDNITNVFVRVVGAEAGDQRSKELNLKIEVLKNMPIFRYLNYKELVRVMNMTAVRTFPPAELIIKEDTPGEELYILLEGQVRLHKDDAFITTLRRGDHFGEMALVDRAPRSASATSEGDSRLLVINRKDFYDIIRNESKLSVKLLWSFVQVLTQRLRKTTAELSGARLEASLPDLTDHALFEEDGRPARST
jgi:serine/threonine protein phosphatase PrpC